MADSEWLMVKTKNGWLSEPALVILMSTDPEPCHGFTVKNAKRMIALRAAFLADSGRRAWAAQKLWRVWDFTTCRSPYPRLSLRRCLGGLPLQQLLVCRYVQRAHPTWRHLGLPGQDAEVLRPGVLEPARGRSRAVSMAFVIGSLLF